MENQGEYEGQNFNFTSADNMDNGGSQNLTKLTTANMEDMEEYYNFGKDTSSYTTPWAQKADESAVTQTMEESGEGLASATASVWKNSRWGGNVLDKRHSSWNQRPKLSTWPPAPFVAGGGGDLYVVRIVIN